jgi:uncharacterized membrane protein
MMFDRAYRQRLEADLARWEADGVITPAVVAAIRIALPPLSPGINIAVVVAIVGGLLIAAAFLAFVAAHWIEIARLLRLAILFAGILTAHGLGGWFARAGQPVLADLCAAVGAIIFGAGIALVGQMYHLGGDFAGGMLLWAVGALATAALTGSRGALAVALVAASIWSCMRVTETDVPHFAFVALWLLAGGLALTWNSRVAAHLVAVAAVPWWIASSFQTPQDFRPSFMLANGAALLFGGGMALAVSPWPRVARVGSVLSIYGAFSLAGVAILEATLANEVFRTRPVAGIANQPLWTVSCGVAGVILAFAATATTRRAGTAFAAGAIGLVLAAVALWTPPQSGEPWPAYAALLCAMLCLVVSGMLDAARPRIVAGWLGIAGVIAAITWAVKGSLLNRSIFLAVAGMVAVVLALVLNRFVPRTRE